VAEGSDGLPSGPKTVSASSWYEPVPATPCAETTKKPSAKPVRDLWINFFPACGKTVENEKLETPAGSKVLYSL